MTEARIEEIVAWYEASPIFCRLTRGESDAIIADWRAKKAEIERLAQAVKGYAEALEISRKEGFRLVGEMKSAEATRAKCEAVARAYDNRGDLVRKETAEDIADSIAALKQS